MQNFRSELRILTLALLAVLFVLSACRKDGEVVAELLTASEAAEITESAVSERTAGATLPTIDMTELLASIPQTCNTPGDTTIQKSNAFGAASYSCTFNLSWLLHCNNAGIPQSADVDVSGNGTFASAHWSGADQTTGELTITGIAPSATDYVVSGAYSLTGNLTGNLRRTDPTLDVQTTVTLANLTVRKSDYQITDGDGTVSVTASNGQGQSQTLTGTLVFNGDGTVTVTVNGHTHTFPI